MNKRGNKSRDSVYSVQNLLLSTVESRPVVFPFGLIIRQSLCEHELLLHACMFDMYVYGGCMHVCYVRKHAFMLCMKARMYVVYESMHVWKINEQYFIFVCLS